MNKITRRFLSVIQNLFVSLFFLFLICRVTTDVFAQSDPRTNQAVQKIISQLVYNEANPDNANHIVELKTGIWKEGCEPVERVTKGGTTEELRDENALLRELKEITGYNAIVLESDGNVTGLSSAFANGVFEGVNNGLIGQNEDITLDILINNDRKVMKATNGDLYYEIGLFIVTNLPEPEKSEIIDLTEEIQNRDENPEFKQKKLVNDICNTITQKTLHLTEVKFSSGSDDTFIEIGDKNKPHWKKNENNEIETRSLCFVKNNAVYAAPKIFIDDSRLPSNTNSIVIKALFEYNGKNDEKTVQAKIITEGTKKYIVPRNSFTIIEKLNDIVDLIEPFKIKWQVALENEGEYVDVGNTENNTFIILEIPYAVYDIDERLYYFGCKYGKGTNTKQEYLDKIWTTKFDLSKGTAITQTDFGMKEKLQLKYYGNPNTVYINKIELISNGDGQCSAWSHLLFDVLYYQGFDFSDIGYKSIRPELNNDDYPEHFLVKNWDIPTDTDREATINHSPKNISVYYCNRRFVENREIKRKVDGTGTYEWVAELNPGQIVQRLPGIPGQGTDNPVSDFDFHSILQITIDGIQKYYDPSYGKIYESKQEIQMAIDGYYLLLHDDRVEITTKENLRILAYPVMFRKNLNFKLIID